MKAFINLLLLVAIAFCSTGQARVIDALENITVSPSATYDIIFNGEEVQVNGKLIVLNTLNGAVACPVMTETQRDAISAPIEGECAYNSTSGSLNIYDGASWASVGTTLYSNPNPSFADTEIFGASANALATGSTAFGTNAIASGTDSSVLGFDSEATGDRTIAIGHDATANGTQDIAIGFNASAIAQDGVAVGASSNAGASSVSIGKGATSGVISIAIGHSSQATGQESIVIGRLSITSAIDAVVVGSGSNAGDGGISLGQNTDASGQNTIMIGHESQGGAFTNAILIGEGLTATANDELNIDNTITGDTSLGNVTIANDLTISGTLSGATVVSGSISNPNISFADTEIFGDTADAVAVGATAFGKFAVATGADSIAIGNASASLGSAGVAVGHDADAVGANSVSVGFNSTSTGTSSVAIGAGANATANDAVSIGLSANTGLGSVAIGWSSANTGQLGVTVGRNHDSTADNVVGIGANGTAGGDDSVAIGYNADTTGARSILLGADIVGGAYTDVVIIGEGITATANDELNIADTITGDLSTGDVTIAGDLTVTGDLIGAGGVIDLDTFYRDDFSVNKSSFFSVTGDNATPDNAGTGTMSGSLTTRTGASAMNGIHDNGFLSDGGGTNDFFLSDTIPVAEVYVSQTATFSFYYEWNGADDDMSFIVLDSTNDTVISHATNHDLKLTGEPTRFYATIEIPPTCTDIRYGFQRNASTLKTLYFTNVTFKTPLLELFQTKSLASDKTSTADLSDLQFDNLTIGRTYTVGGTVLSTSTDDVTELNAYSAATGGGTHYGLLHMNWDTDDTGYTTQGGKGVNISFTAVSTTMYVRLLAPFGALLQGDGTINETHIILTEEVDKVETSKF